MSDLTLNRQLRIKQQNCKHSKILALSMLESTDPALWDIILIQEPYIYPNTRHTTSSSKWITLYPTAPGHLAHMAPRSVIFINALLSLELYQQVKIPSNEITAVHFQNAHTSLTLFNIYNPPESNMALKTLEEWLLSDNWMTLQPDDQQMIWAGDFNKHNPLWSGPDFPHRTQQSDTELLVELLATYDLRLQLPEGTPTFQSNAHLTWSTLDLVFCTPDLQNLFLACDAPMDE
jgi:Endonuclease-reverse transcriptase